MQAEQANLGEIQVSNAGELHWPSGAGNGRAALVLHEAPGITGNVRRRCAMLANLGYVAFAPDLHLAGRFLSPTESQAAVVAFRAAPELLRAQVESSLSHLLTTAGVACRDTVVLGYCFGGMAALELARGGADVAAVASFHGLLKTTAPACPTRIKTPILVCTGGLDALVPPQDVLSFQQEMTAAQADWQLIVYGQAKHSFTNSDAATFGDPRMSYHPQVDRRSWAAAMEFFDEVFG